MIDVNKPITNPELVAAMEALQKNATPENEKMFLDLLRNAYFLVPLEGGLQHDEPGADGKITLTKGTTINFPMLSDTQGDPWHIAFTDWPSLRTWRNNPNEETLIVEFSDFPSMILREGSKCVGLLINPSSHNFPVNRQILAVMSSRANPIEVKETTQVLIGEPADYPHTLADAIRALLKTMRGVKKAWLLLMRKGDEESFLVVVDFSGDRRTAFDTIGQTAAPHLKTGQFIDMVSYSDNFGMNAVKNHKPFYKKSLFG